MKPTTIISNIVILSFFFGCVAEAKLMNGSDENGTAVYLSEPSDIPKAIKKFQLNRDLTTEEGKIDYILFRLRSSNLRFIRNGEETNGDNAAQFMRWKMGWYKDHHHTKIKTLQDFVSKVAKGSEKTGQPYVLILPDGSRHNAQYVLQNEANKLEELLAPSS